VLEDGLRTGRVTQVSGLRYTFDPKRPAGSRITEVRAGDGGAFDTTRVWTLAANNFMADGGDEMSTLSRGQDKKDTRILVRDAMEQFVKERCAGGKSLDYKLDGRITRVGGDASE
jgi:5'-nucleotidase